MQRARGALALAVVLTSLAVLVVADGFDSDDWKDWRRWGFDRVIDRHAEKQLEEGKRAFRDDTFGDEVFWGGVIRLHEAIEGTGFGGVGDGISPKEALAVGLKVDVERLPRDLRRDLAAGKVDLDAPATTLALLRLKAVVGVTGFFDDNPAAGLRSLGLQCAFCHSTVDDSFAPGIGRRLDGWANRDLNVGAIVNLSPDLSAVATLLGVPEPVVRTVLLSWGPGRFDAELFLDGKAFGPNGTAATLIPPAFGLSGVDKHTYTGWGSVPYWNAFVANLEMHGQGTFYDSRLKDATKFPVAAANGFDNVRSDNDRITPKLAALHFYQLAHSRAGAPARLLRPARGRPRKGALLRQGRLRALPRAAALHRARLEHAHARRDRDRQLPGGPLPGRALPHDAAQGRLEPLQGRLLPRRPLPDAPGRGRPLQWPLPALPHSGGEERPRRVPEIALRGVRMHDPAGRIEAAMIPEAPAGGPARGRGRLRPPRAPASKTKRSCAGCGPARRSFSS